MGKNVTTRQWSTILAVGGLALALLLVAMDQTIVATALPRIAADLHGFSLYSWVTTAYLLAETAIIPIASKLGDLFGRKWVMITGVAVFIGCSALCGLAPNMMWLVIFRGLQGLGGGSIFSTVFTLVADIFPNPLRRARYQGLFGGVFAVASVIAPFVGGILTDTLSWRAIFYVNLPLGLLALAVLPHVLPMSERVKHAPIDFLGAVTSVITIVSLLLALTFVGNGASWTSAQVVIGLAVAAVGLALFIPIEMRAAEPIVPMRLLRNRTLLTVTGVLFLFGAAMFGVTIYIPLFVQAVLGQSATSSGTILLPLVLTMSLMSIVTGLLVGRLGSLRTWIISGMVLFTVGAFFMSRLGVGTSYVLISVYLFIIGIGLGMTLPSATLAVQTDVDQKDLGSATSMTQFIRSIGSTVGTAVIAWLVTSNYSRNLVTHAPKGTPSSLLTLLASPNALTSASSQAALKAAARAAHATNLVESLLAAARTALSAGIHDGMLFVLGCGVLAVLTALLLPRITLKKTQREDKAVRAEDEASLVNELVAP
jgi:EmrB/QacA subfamily drug resistance transporter